jgi:spermidine synthase
MKLQRMLGHISALAVDEPKSVLVIACGAGVTAGTFLLHPTIEEIYICDIESLVPRDVAPLFSKENYGITDAYKDHPSMNDPMIVNGKKVYVISDDGRHFIRTAKRKFDIISSDPIDPWVKGCAALNTVEYYRMCMDHLNPGGVMSLWIPLYEGKLQTTKSVIGTFFDVFKKGIMWSNDDNGKGYDAVLFGQPEGSHFDVDALQERLDAAPEVKTSLEEVGFRSAVDLLATFAAYAPDMGEWMADAQINHDRDMRLQYIAGWNFNSFENENILNDILRYRRIPENLFSGSESSLEELFSRLTRANPD